MRKLYNVKDDLNNVLGAIGRFARAAVSNKQLLALVLLALVSGKINFSNFSLRPSFTLNKPDS